MDGWVPLQMNTCKDIVEFLFYLIMDTGNGYKRCI